MSNRMKNIGNHHTNKHFRSVEEKAKAKRYHLGKYVTAVDISERIAYLNNQRAQLK